MTPFGQAILFSPELEKFLHPDYFVLRKKIRKQAPDTIAMRSLETGAETGEMSLRFLLVITFFTNIVLSGGMRYMLLLIRTL